MAQDSNHVRKSINIKPNASPDLSSTGDIGVDSADSNRLKFNDGSGAQRVTLKADLDAEIATRAAADTAEATARANADTAIQTQVTTNTSGLSAHTGASSGVHGVTGSVVGTSDSQTLSNKTLSSPVLNTPTADTITGKSGGALTLAGASNQDVTISSNGTGKINADNLTFKTNTIASSSGNITINPISNSNLLLNGSGTGNIQLMKAGVAVATVDTAGVTLASGKTIGSGTGTIAPNSSGAITIPNATDTLVGKATTDTLTNKTLTSPVINSPTGIVKGDVGLGNVDNTSDATKNSAVATLTNKTLTTPVVDVLSMTDQGSTPASPSSGTHKVYVKSDGKAYILDSTGTEVAMGTGSGGDTNFIGNPDAATATTGWATYADAAGTSPVDGTGGAPSSTFTRSTASPLVGAASFLWTKSAANRQGEGFSYDFTIDSAYQAKVLQISFEYLVASGTFVAGTSTTDSDMTVWIYDKTNGVLISPTTQRLFANSSTISTTFISNFQSASNSTSYRLIVHTGSTSASAYTLKFDEFKVTPSKYVYGTTVTDWQSYTPTWSGLTIGNATQRFFWRRVGDTMEVTGNFIFGTTSSATGTIKFSLPSGYNADGNKLPGSQVGASSYTRVGYATAYVSGVKSYFMILQDIGSLNTFYMSGKDGATVVDPMNNTSFTWANLSEIQIVGMQLPIAGWSSSVQTSDQADSRVIAANAYLNSAQSMTTTAAPVQFNVVDFDTAGAYNTSTYTYTCPCAGYYSVDASLTAQASAGNFIYGYIYKNGASLVRNQAALASGADVSLKVSRTVKCNAGDTLQIYVQGSATVALEVGSIWNYLSISRLSQASLMSATESVTCRYSSSNTPTVSTYPTATALAFNTKTYDSHGAYNTTTGLFTAPTSGKYRVICKPSLTAARAATSGFLYFELQKNGSLYAELGCSYGNGSTQSRIVGADEVDLKAGDTLGVGFSCDIASQTLASGSSIVITRVGN